MKLTFKRVRRLLTEKSDRSRQVELCERLNFELPFYINELALYKFILERQSANFLERQHFLEQHSHVRERCLKAIQELNRTANELHLPHRYDIQTYLTQYQAYSVIQ